MRVILALFAAGTSLSGLRKIICGSFVVVGFIYFFLGGGGKFETYSDKLN